MSTGKRPQLSVVGAEQPQHVGIPQSLQDILNEPLDDWQIEGLLPRESVCVVFGDAQAGKTFLALDLSAHILTGTQWQGREVLPGSVIYIAGEGGSGLKKRLRALIQAHPAMLSAPFRLLRQAVNVREHWSEIVTRCKDVAEEAGNLGLIVIDTLSQTIFGDENSADMAEYVSAATELARATKASVLIVHHQGKDGTRGARGSSALRGNVDVMIKLEMREGFRTGTTDPAAGGKIKDGEPVEFGFRLKPVNVGKTRRGQVETSCIVEWLDDAQASAAAKKKPIRGADQRLIYELAGDLARAGGVAGQLRNGRPVFSLDELRQAWQAAKRASKGRSEPSYFNRALRALVDGGHVMHDGDKTWFA